MSQTKKNIDYLRKIITGYECNTDEAIKFLDAIESEINELNDEIKSLEIEIKNKDEEMYDLESEIEKRESINTIECGIGEINYESPNNLVLIDVMENLEAAIKKTTPKKVNEILSAI